MFLLLFWWLVRFRQEQSFAVREDAKIGFGSDDC